MKLALYANRMKESFLEKMGALYPITKHFAERNEKLDEQAFLEKYPCFKGQHDRFLRATALAQIKNHTDANG